MLTSQYRNTPVKGSIVKGSSHRKLHKLLSHSSRDAKYFLIHCVSFPLHGICGPSSHGSFAFFRVVISYGTHAFLDTRLSPTIHHSYAHLFLFYTLPGGLFISFLRLMIPSSDVDIA